MSAVKTHKNITLWTYSEVSRVDGYVGNYKVRVTRKPRYIKEELCIGCLECITDCLYKDARFPDEFNQGLSKRKPIYIPFPQATPQVVLVDPETCIQVKSGKCKKPCVEACDRGAIDFTQTEEIKELEVGTIILATGFQVFDAARSPFYGYGIHPNVYTALVPRAARCSCATGRRPRQSGSSTAWGHGTRRPIAGALACVACTR